MSQGQLLSTVASLRNAFVEDPSTWRPYRAVLSAVETIVTSGTCFLLVGFWDWRWPFDPSMTFDSQ